MSAIIKLDKGPARATRDIPHLPHLSSLESTGTGLAPPITGRFENAHNIGKIILI